VNFNSEIADSRPHLSAAARRAKPARQRAAATWPPRAVPTAQLKAAVGTVRRASRQLPHRTPRRARQPPRIPRRRPDRLASAPLRLDRRLTDRAAVPTASPTPPCPDRRLADRVAVPTAHRRRTAVYRTRAGEPLLLSRFRPPAPRRRRLVEQRRRAPCAACARSRRAPAEVELGRQRRAHGPRTLRRPRPWAAPVPHTRIVPHVATGRAIHCASGPSGFGPVPPG
jgi:hypothetical protein